MTCLLINIRIALLCLVKWTDYDSAVSVRNSNQDLWLTENKDRRNHYALLSRTVSVNPVVKFKKYKAYACDLSDNLSDYNVT